MEEPKIKFASVLKEFMTKNELTGKQLASLINVPESTISTWLNSGSAPQNINAVRACARVFNTTLYFMIYGESELDAEQAEIKSKFREIVAGKFELVLRPLE